MTNESMTTFVKGQNIGIHRVPGTKIGNSTREVIYTPPEGETVIREKLAALERFIHADDDIDPLIKLALMHYQFEAIQITAFETQERVKKILEAMEKTKTLVQAKARKIYSKDLIEVIFQNPYCKIRSLEEAGVAKRDAASNYLHVLEELKVLKSVKYGREVYYINEKLIKILSK